MTTKPARPSSWQVWLTAIRPKTLPAAVAPVLAGVALAVAHGRFRLSVALVTLATALLLQIGVNLANDAQDYQRGADDPAARLGPPRVTALGWRTPRQVLGAAALVFALALLLGVYLVAVGGWPILAIGLSAIVAAWAYSGGPYPIAYHGLGEVFVLLYFGLFAVAGTYYLQTGMWHPGAWLLGLALGSLNAAILVVNNYRDLENDRRAGKGTLAVRLGPRGARGEYAFFLVLPYVLAVGALLGGLWPRGSVLVFLTLPWAWRAWQGMRTRQGRALNPVLAQTGQLALLYALAFAAGCVWTLRRGGSARLPRAHAGPRASAW